MEENYMTELDRLGMFLAAKARLEKRFGFLSDRVLKGNITALGPLDELLKKDADREKDGFPKKIKFRRVLTGSGKVINIPFVEEEQLVHGDFEPKRVVEKFQSLDDDNGDDKDISEGPGHGEGNVGDVIGEVPLPLGGGDGDDGDGDDDGQDQRAGDQEGDHGFEEEAYETGKRLMEQLQLPNLKEKVKKVPTEEYIYDLTDRRQGSGQLLDKKETLRRIVKTNIILGRVDKDNLDTTKMVVGPQDKTYRVLSRERVFKSQAVVFFLRDYSGSMWGDPTRVLVAQHLMIYAWLLVQYEKRVIPRFILHDTKAKEVPAKQYFGLGSSGRTMIASGYKKINEIVQGEGLESSYNIYVFQGTDGDDFDDGRVTLPELEKILQYVNRMGVCLFKSPYYGSKGVKTSFEQYIEKGGIINRKDVFRMYTLPSQNITEEDHIKALKAMIAQD